MRTQRVKRNSPCGSPSIAASSSSSMAPRITSEGGLLAYRELDDALDVNMVGVSALLQAGTGCSARCGRRSTVAS